MKSATLCISALATLPEETSLPVGRLSDFAVGSVCKLLASEAAAVFAASSCSLRSFWPPPKLLLMNPCSFKGSAWALPGGCASGRALWCTAQSTSIKCCNAPDQGCHCRGLRRGRHRSLSDARRAAIRGFISMSFATNGRAFINNLERCNASISLTINCAMHYKAMWA